MHQVAGEIGVGESAAPQADHLRPAAPDRGGGGVAGRPATPEEFLSRYEGLTRALLDNPRICAFCYTQLYDVEQEVNGLYTYERVAKFDPESIRRINASAAAVER